MLQGGKSCHPIFKKLPLIRTPPPGRGKRQYHDEFALEQAVLQVLEQYDVKGLLQVSWQREETTVTRDVGRGRGSPTRPTRTEVRVRSVITEVKRDHAAIAQKQHRLGWRVQGTCLPLETMSLTGAVIHDRGGWSLERGFPLFKDRPLGISPLYVRCDDQIRGLTRLLTLGWRLLTLIEAQVRRQLEQTGEELVGLYEGDPKRTMTRPTEVRLLKAFGRAEITLTRVEWGQQHLWHLTPLSALLERVLAPLGLSASVSQRLVENSS